MIAYVSAAFGDWKETRAVQTVLLRMGYVIEDDWTDDAERVFALGPDNPEHKDEMPEALQREIAEEHIRASAACHRHVLVCGPNFGSCFGGIGEFFIAQFNGAQCDVISPPRNSVFHKLSKVTVYEDFNAWWRASTNGNK